VLLNILYKNHKQTHAACMAQYLQNKHIKQYINVNNTDNCHRNTTKRNGHATMSTIPGITVSDSNVLCITVYAHSKYISNAYPESTNNQAHTSVYHVLSCFQCTDDDIKGNRFTRIKTAAWNLCTSKQIWTQMKTGITSNIVLWCSWQFTSEILHSVSFETLVSFASTNSYCSLASFHVKWARLWSFSDENYASFLSHK